MFKAQAIHRKLTRRSAGLLEAYPETLIEISPEDATRVDIEDSDQIRVKSRRGEMSARAVITNRTDPGVVFGNFHFPGAANANKPCTWLVAKKRCST